MSNYKHRAHDEEVTAGSVMKLAMDKLRIGKAMLSSDQVKEAIMKSTSHKNVPPKEKHVRRLIGATGEKLLPALVDIVEEMGKRVTKSNDWKVVLKALQVFHRMIQEAHPSFTRALMTAGVGRLLNVQTFKDRSTNVAMEQQAFIRQYARFVEERIVFYRSTNIRQLSSRFTIDKMMDLLGKNEKNSSSSSSSSMHSRSFDRGYEGDSNDSGNDSGLDNERDDGNDRRRSNKRYKASDLFYLMESLHDLMEELLRSHDYLRTSTVQQIATASAFSLLIQDSRSIYKMQTMAIMALIDIYFTLSPKEARIGLDLTKANKKQTEKLLHWYEFAANCRVVKQSLVPNLKPQPDELLESMRMYLETGEIPDDRHYNVDDRRSHSPDSNVPTSNLRDLLSEEEIEHMSSGDSDHIMSKTPVATDQGGDELLFLSQESSIKPAERAVDELFGTTTPNNNNNNNNAVDSSDPFGDAPLQQAPQFQSMSNMHQSGPSMMYNNGPFAPAAMNPYGYPAPMMMMQSHPGNFSPGMHGGFGSPQHMRPNAVVNTSAPPAEGEKASITGRKTITSSNKSPAKAKTESNDPFSSLLNDTNIENPWL